MTRVIVESILTVISFGAGVLVGRKYEQKIVARALAFFASANDEAKSAVSIAYNYLSAGLKAELKKLGL
jgi:hypothetical protein